MNAITAADAVERFLKEHAGMRGIDHERVAALHEGHEREAVLTVAALHELVRTARQAEELRRAVAEQVAADPETWPSHGNAPLAIAALAASRHRRAVEVTAELEEVRNLWAATRAELAAAYEEMRKLRPAAIFDAAVWERARSAG